MKKKIDYILYGVLFLAIGVIVIGNLLNFWNIDLLFKGWWALFIIIPSVFDIIKRGISFGNTFTLGIGVILLLMMQEYISRDILWQVIIAFGFILLGLYLIIRFAFGKKPDWSKYSNFNNSENEFAIFGSFAPNYNGKEFNGLKCSIVFSGGEIDLRNAIIKENCSINCDTVFGGTEILLPDNVNCEILGGSIFGGLDNKLSSRPVNPENPTVKIYAHCVFGGIEIK